MGNRGQEIVQLHLKEVLELLNKALADEWLAYYQYWVGAKVVKGPTRKDVVEELEEHAKDELKHADMLVQRILQLGGVSLLKPEDWYKMTNCGYIAPEDFAIKAIVEQNIKGERCAIDVYNRIVKITHEKDILTYQMALDILREEVEHEDDLQMILEDLEGF